MASTVDRFYYSRMSFPSYRREQPRGISYLVYAGSTVGTHKGKRRVDHKAVFLGTVERKVWSRKQVRHGYGTPAAGGWAAHPASSDFVLRRAVGKASTVEQAAELLVDHLSTTRSGRNVLKRAGMKPTKRLKKQVTAPPGWSDRQKAALRRLLKRLGDKVKGYEVLAESENSWEVRVDFKGRKSQFYQYLHPYAGAGRVENISCN